MNNFFDGLLAALVPPLGLAVAGYDRETIVKSIGLTLLFYVPGSLYAVFKLLEADTGSANVEPLVFKGEPLGPNAV